MKCTPAQGFSPWEAENLRGNHAGPPKKKPKSGSDVDGGDYAGWICNLVRLTGPFKANLFCCNKCTLKPLGNKEPPRRKMSHLKLWFILTIQPIELFCLVTRKVFGDFTAPQRR